MSRGRVAYEQDQIDEFIAVAQEKGIGPAMRELGFPGSHHTAAKWFTDKGLEMPDVSYLARKARALKEFYTDREELALVQTAYDRLMEQLEGKQLNAEELNKIINALQKAVQTANLIKGKATNIGESHTKDATDLEIAKLVKEMENVNAETVKAI